MATIDNRPLKAYVRFDGTGRIVPSSLILRRKKPKVGKWVEIPAYECCNNDPTTTSTTSTTTTAAPEPILLSYTPNYDYGSCIGEGGFPISVAPFAGPLCDVVSLTSSPTLFTDQGLSIGQTIYVYDEDAEIAVQFIITNASTAIRTEEPCINCTTTTTTSTSSSTTTTTTTTAAP